MDTRPIRLNFHAAKITRDDDTPRSDAECRFVEPRPDTGKRADERVRERKRRRISGK